MLEFALGLDAMTETEARYHVLLIDGKLRNDVGEMSEQHLYAYLRNRRLRDYSAESVLQHLEQKGSMTVYFDPIMPEGTPTVVQIRKNDSE